MSHQILSRRDRIWWKLSENPQGSTAERMRVAEKKRSLFEVTE